MEIEPMRGGFRKPISTREFVLEYLRSNGEAYVAEMHRAYKDKLAAIASANAEVPPYSGQGRRPATPRPKKYTYPRYHSFQAEVWRLAQGGLIELARSEPTQGVHDQFKGFEKPPERHYYKIITEG